MYQLIYLMGKNVEFVTIDLSLSSQENITLTFLYKNVRHIANIKDIKM